MNGVNITVSGDIGDWNKAVPGINHVSLVNTIAIIVVIYAICYSGGSYVSFSLFCASG